MPLYGRGFTLASAAQNGINAYAPQGIAAGPYTQETGIWGYNEVIMAYFLIQLNINFNLIIDLREVRSKSYIERLGCGSRPLLPGTVRL